MNLLVLSSVWFLRLFGMLRNSRIIVRIASSREISNTGLLTKVLKPLYKIPNDFIVISKGLQEGLQQKYSIASEKIKYIPNAIELSASASEDTKKVFDLVTIGRYVKAKDHETLLHAISLLVHYYGYDDFSACFVSGSGELEQETKALADELRVNNQVNFPGKISYAEGQLRLKAAKIFVLSSLLEGFGIVILEGMRAGLPVISTDCPVGPGEILENGKYGILIPVKDPYSMAAAVNKLLKDSQLYEKYSTLSQQRVKEYDIKVIAKRYDELFTQ
jgi:glycosyltransferase involved in cell wall biosynthesis